MPRSTSLEKPHIQFFSRQMLKLYAENPSTNLPPTRICSRLMPTPFQLCTPTPAHRHRNACQITHPSRPSTHPHYYSNGPTKHAPRTLWASLSALSSHHLIPIENQGEPTADNLKLSPKLLGKKAPALSLPWAVGAPSTWAKPSLLCSPIRTPSLPISKSLEMETCSTNHPLL